MMGGISAPVEPSFTLKEMVGYVTHPEDLKTLLEQLVAEHGRLLIEIAAKVADATAIDQGAENKKAALTQMESRLNDMATEHSKQVALTHDAIAKQREELDSRSAMLDVHNRELTDISVSLENKETELASRETMLAERDRALAAAQAKIDSEHVELSRKLGTLRALSENIRTAILTY